MRILLIDNHLEQLLNFEKKLTARFPGIQCLMAINLEDAKEQCQKNPVDLIALSPSNLEFLEKYFQKMI